MTVSPPFGEADLSNCERELIHLAASIQPHGALLNVDGSSLEIVQVSSNAKGLLGRDPNALLGQPLGVLGGNIEERVRSRSPSAATSGPVTLRCSLLVKGEPQCFEGMVHRVEGRWLVVEIEPVDAKHQAVPTAGLEGPLLQEQLELAIQEISAASTVSVLAETVVRVLRRLTEYDRVMVYRFDPEGHGKIIAEDRAPQLDSFLGHHYPASDIPQRARRLYLRNRLRLLVDVDYEPAALRPRSLPEAVEGELDMSMCYLRSMSPLHLQYLKNMGVSATLVISIVRAGQLWGLIAAHHYSARNLPLVLRTACDVLAEVVATRLAAIENYVYAHVAIQVQRLEQRLVEATSTDGDWRAALFRNPWTLLQPVEASGAVLFCQGDMLTAGDVPSTPELRALIEWLETLDIEHVFGCSSISRANAALSALSPMASGVLAVKLSSTSPDYLVWLRKEQLRNVTWAGDPSKPVIGDDPMTLSPRRSFAAWTELVRGTALPWTSSELALARAFGTSLSDIIGRVNAVQFLIAAHQVTAMRQRVRNVKHLMLLVGPDEQVLEASDAYRQFFGAPSELPSAIIDILRGVSRHRHGWRGRLQLTRRDGQRSPVEVHVESVPDRGGHVLGYFLLFEDLSEAERTNRARQALERSFERGASLQQPDRVISAVLANASMAAMDIADGHLGQSVSGALNELEASTDRATVLYRRMLALTTET